MARILITGSSTGLGLMAAKLLIDEGHQVVLHGRDRDRADAAMASAPGAAAAVVGDLSCISQMLSVAEQANDIGRFEAIIHNAGVGYREPQRIETEDGLPHVFAVNVLAPYVLTARIGPPDRLIFMSSAIHRAVEPNLQDLLWLNRQWDGRQAYAESKLHDALLAFALARLWPTVRCNAVEPGWVPTRMGGPDACDDLSKAHRTQAWLAVSSDPLALRSGEYFHHQALCDPSAFARSECIQNELLDACKYHSNLELASPKHTNEGN